MKQEDIGLQHYFDILWRRIWAIGVVFLIVMSLSAIGIVLNDPTYTTHSKVAIKNNIYYRTSMLSFAPGTDAPTTTLSGTTYEDKINGLPFAHLVATYMLTQGAPLDPLEIRGTIRGEYQEPDLIRIHASHTDPNMAVLIANSAADTFVEETRRVSREELLKGKESVQVSMAKARAEAENLELQISEFHQSMGFIDMEGAMEAMREKIATFERARGEVVTELEVTLAQQAELKNLAEVGASGGISLEDPGLEEYRSLQMAAMDARIRYTDDHPRVKNLTTQIERIEAKLKEAIARSGSSVTPEVFLTLKDELARTEARIANLQTAIGSWTEQIKTVDDVMSTYPEQMAAMNVLESRLQAARESYKIWSTRVEEIDFKASKVPANAELLDHASTPTPQMGKKTAFMLALIVSLMIGLGTGLLVEFADTAVRTPEEITNTIGLTFLGSIRKMKEDRPIVFEDGKPVNQEAESYTRIYSNIKFAEVETPLRSVLITSARKGEGKSTTLVNLACAIAAAGKRVIVVDADLRNPTAQRILGAKKAGAGLTSVLAGQSLLSEVLTPTIHPGLTLLPTGPIPPNPAELLHSQAMKDLIHKLEGMADIVLFDGPPVLLVADSMLLGAELDAALIVAESGGVSKSAVTQVKESLEVAKARILGVVLNKVEDSPGASFYNYYSYYKTYHQPEESAAPPKAATAWFKGLRKTMGGRG